MMKSLKDRLMFWKSGKAPEASVPRFDFHNELLIEPGSYVSLDLLDFKDRKLKVEAYQEWRQEANGVTSRFTDYSFKEEPSIKLRAFDDSAEKDDNIWLLSLYHEQPFDQDLIGIVEHSCRIDPETMQRGPFHVNHDDGTTSFFKRFLDLEQPHLAYTYPERGSYRYWDFYNQDFPHQLLYVEMNVSTGYIKMWLAERVPLADIFVV